MCARLPLEVASAPFIAKLATHAYRASHSARETSYSRLLAFWKREMLQWAILWCGLVFNCSSPVWRVSRTPGWIGWLRNTGCLPGKPIGSECCCAWPCASTVELIAGLFSKPLPSPLMPLSSQHGIMSLSCVATHAPLLRSLADPCAAACLRVLAHFVARDQTDILTLSGVQVMPVLQPELPLLLTTSLPPSPPP